MSQDEDLLPHAFGLALDEAGAAKPRAGEGAQCIAGLSLAEERLAAGKGRGLGFGAAAAGPMLHTSSAAAAGDAPRAAEAGPGAANGSAAEASEETGSLPTRSAVPRSGKEAPLSSELVAAFMARLRFQRHFQQVRAERMLKSLQPLLISLKHLKRVPPPPPLTLGST